MEASEDLLSNDMNEKFSIEMCGDLDFNGMVIDISYNMTNIASVNYEKGIDNIEIEILPFGDNTQKLIFPLQGFLNALEKAKRLAKQCAEEDKFRE